MERPTVSFNLLTTIRSLRLLFATNREKPFEARWAIAKQSDAYVGFRICCTVCARYLIIASLPLFLIGYLFKNSQLGAAQLNVGSERWSRFLVAGGMALYVTLSFLVAWKLGVKAARKALARRIQ